MRKSFFIIFALFATFLFSCDRGNQEIDGLRERIEAMEKRIDGLDSDVERLNAIVLQITGGGYVTAVIPNGQGEDINGYILSFNDGSNVYINVTKASSPAAVSFVGVDTSNPDYVVITLSDGTQLRLPTWAAFDALQQQVKQLNINLASLNRIVSALQDNDYLVSTTPFVEDGVPVGWLLNFSKSGLVVIYSSGTSATPQIGVRQDTDGVYYWTINGDWLLDSDGRKVRAQGSNGADAVAPRIKIDEGYWWISYDDGATWSQLGKATGEDGDSFFYEVDTSHDDFVRLVLSDGTTLDVPKYVALDIMFDLDGGELLLSDDETIAVAYELVGTFKDDITVSALVNGSLSAEVVAESAHSGKVRIVGTGRNAGGSVVVMLSNPNGYSVVRVLTCIPRRLTLYDSAGNACETHLRTMEYYFPVSHEGGTIKIRYKSNTPFVLGPTPEWLRVVKGYDGPSGEIVLEADANSSASVRECHLGINYASPYSVSPDDIYCVIGITQNSSFFEMNPTFIRASAEFTQYKIDIKCSLDDLSMSIAEGSDWLMGGIWRSSTEAWCLNVAVTHNQTASERTGTVDVLHEGKVLGTLTVVQNAQDAEEITKMILKVIATPANGYMVYLPLTGQMDCSVEWGDTYGCSITSTEGYKDHLNHKYNCTEPTEYTVKISGNVKGLDSGNLSSYITVVSVEQWGQLGLTSMDHAFCGVTTLESVATDEQGGFSGVTTFASAFEGCASLTKVPASLFDHAKGVVSFRRCFYKVDKVTTESPYTVVGDEKVHLYERGQYDVFSPLTDWSNCFFGGNWADMEQIKLHKGWD